MKCLKLLLGKKAGKSFQRVMAAMLSASMILSGQVVPTFAAETQIEESVEYIDEAVTAEEMLIEDEDSIVVDAKDATEAALAEMSDIESDDAKDTEVQAGSAEDALDDAAADDEISIKEAEALESYDAKDAANGEKGAAITNAIAVGLTQAKAVFDKKNKLVVSWKKSKVSKLFNVYYIDKDGNVTANTIPGGNRTNKTKLSIVPNDDYSYAYKIEGLDAAGAKTGEYAYVLATPTVTLVQRHGDINDAHTQLEFSYRRINGATGYTAERGLKKNKEFETVTTSLDGEVFSAAFQGGQVAQIKDVDAHSFDGNQGDYYFYHVMARMEIKGLDEVLKSEYSAAVRGRVTVRAPREGVVKEIKATSVYLTWEDMTAIDFVEDENGKLIPLSSGDRILSSDSYNIYCDMNDSGKFKKLKTIKANDEDITYFAGGVTPYDGTVKRDYATVGYKLKGLKPETKYTFKVAAVANKVEGARSEGKDLVTYTELGEVTGVSDKNSNYNSVTVSFNEVSGATGYRIYYTTNGMTQAEAEGGFAAWGGISRMSYVDVPNKPNSKDVCSATIKGLKNKQYYGLMVFALTNKSGDSPVEFGITDTKVNPQRYGTPNTVIIETLISPPKVTVKQDKNKLKFTWDEVANATGYYVEYRKGMEATEKLTIKAGKHSVEVDNLEIGEPVNFKICSIYNEDKSTDPEGRGRVKELNEALAPSTPDIKAIMYNNHAAGLGGMLYIKRPTESYLKPENTIISYKVEISEKKSKDYELLYDYSNCAVQTHNGYDTIADNTLLNDGRDRYYRVYSQVYNKKFDTYTVSRDYDRELYLKPDEATGKTTSVEKDSSATIEISFDPKEATMREVRAWYVATGKTKDFDDAVEFDSNYEAKKTTGSRISNDYITVSKGYEYNSIFGAGAGVYAPKLKIKGKKVGTTYIKAVLADGKEVIFKIRVTEPESSSDDDDDDDSSKTVICLDPGHGGSDDGASSGNLHEKTMALKVSKLTKGYLEGYGYRVYLTRTTDTKVELEDRVKYAKSKGAKAIIAQHFNSGSGTGVECWYSLAYKSSEGKALAENMCDSTAGRTGMNNRGAKKKSHPDDSSQDYYAIIRFAASSKSEYGGKAIIGVIMENGFLQNDAKYMDSDEDLDAIALGNAKGIRKSF